jgi:hypothetical protein
MGTDAAVGAPAPTERRAEDESDLTEKQRTILAYLRRRTEGRSYFKSREIAADLGMTAKEVGANMRPLLEGGVEPTVEKWGYSSGTTWMVTAAGTGPADPDGYGS